MKAILNIFQRKPKQIAEHPEPLSLAEDMTISVLENNHAGICIV